MSTTLTQKYPAKEHAKRVAQWITQHGGDPKGVIYLEAQRTRMKEDNDEPAPFRQRRYFYYLTGCELADCHFTFDLSTGKSTLYIPPVDPDDVIWSGLPMTQEEALAKYDVDSVLSTLDVNPQLASQEISKSTVYAINNQVSEHVTFLPFSATNFDLLKPAIENSRVVKTPYEVALMRKANYVTAIAHTAVMKAARTASNEQELEALFLKNCIERGLKEQSYHGIFASGTNCATLHYVKNDAPLQGKLNMLVDAGAENNCYASDITRTFPINGKFTKESRAIYDIVLRMQEDCTNMLKAGILWDDVHAHAHQIAIEGLLSIGLLRGDAKEIFDSRTSVAFFPHGLGHYLGMDTHDSGGNPNYADADTMFRYLRLRGTVPAGSVVTVEPGIYFCRFIIEPYLKEEKHAKYIDKDVLEQYWEVGGVRIEDNILVTEDGFENLTTTPKAVLEIEQLISG